MNQQKRRGDLVAVRDAGLCLGVAVSTAALTLVFFFPCFTNWQGLRFPELEPTAPEWERARFALVQLDDPAAQIPNTAHYGIKYRLLFPVLSHALRLSHAMYLAIPHLGCLLCLWLVAWLTRRQLNDWFLTWLATALFAALSWFFVSTGWLAYFDSWLVLGLLAASFVPSRPISLAAWALVPWIDERFIFALPVIITVRAVVLLPDLAVRTFLKDLLIGGAICSPYVALRAIEWLAGDAEAVRHVNFHLEKMQDVSLGTYALGLWSGFRAAWVLFAAAIVAVWLSGRRAMAVGLATVSALTALASLMIVADMSRTLMVLAPVMLLGAWQLTNLLGAYGPQALTAVLIANLSLPASHVVWTRTFPIHSLAHEVGYYNDPPGWVFAPEHFRRGNQLLSEGRADEARGEYSQAIRLESHWLAPHIQRAAASAWLGDVSSARKDIDAVLRVNPDSYDALLMRALFPNNSRDRRASIADLERALEHAPPNWPPRAQAEQALLRMRNGAS
ncbi:MAG TPA: hypothetical protein VGN12_22680 [Pirellulales bacterium]|jgi:tetratricopeptide (TPR) repeat protein